MAKQNNLVKNASVLMIASIISRVIGLIYRRPLGSILGSVGVGYYSYARNLYAILLLISSYSIPMAVSKIVSERLAKRQYKNAQKVFKGALLYAVLIGGATALIAFFAGPILLPGNQQNALPALRVLAPTIFFSAILGVFRGYFQAHNTMTPTSVSQIAEQIMNAVVSVLAAWLLIRSFAPEGGRGAAIYGSVGGTLGTGAGVLTGLVFMLFVFRLNRGYFKRERRRDRGRREESYREVFGIIALMITPIIFTTFVNNASAYLDSYLYSTIEGFRGMQSEAISAAYGEYSNYYIPIINIPLALASASASAMMPEVSGEYAIGKVRTANAKIGQTIRLTMFICIPCMFGLTIFAEPIMGVLFPSASELAAKLLLTGSVYVLFASLSTITSSVLQSIGRQKEALYNAVWALTLNLVLLALTLLIYPAMSIYAVMIANILYSFFNWILNIIRLRSYLGFRAEFKKTYLEPIGASLVMAAVSFVLYRLLFQLTRRPSIAVIAAILVAVPVYLIAYVLVSHTTADEMRRYPMGTRIVRLLRRLHIY
jgi:stage V sporulation protein B